MTYARIIKLTVLHRTFFAGAFFALSVFFAAVMQTPTNALTLDLGTTVTNVTKGIPIVNTVTPVLGESPKSTVIVAPVTTKPVTVMTPPAIAPQVSEAISSPSSKQQAAPVELSIPAPSLPTQRTATTSVPDLSAAAKQNEIAAASVRTESPSVKYESRVIDPKIARMVFYLGIIGVLSGGVALYATRPRMVVS